MPDTEAGKRLLAGLERPRYDGGADWLPGRPAQIDAIEAEAVAAERARIKAGVEGLPRAWDDDPDDLVLRDAVLRVVEGEAP